MKIKVITNNHYRTPIYGYELTQKEREWFDYVEDIESHSFIRYRGEVYDPDEFMRVPQNTCAPDGIEALQDWHGYQSDSYFSGVVIKYSDDFEQVKIGTYIS